jgi:transmembrane sensor
MPSNDDYILLLHKSFTGELSPEEKTHLHAWVKQSPDNQRFADELRTVWEKTSNYSPLVQADIEADFSFLQQRILAETPTRVRIVPIGQRLMRIAAVLVLMVAAVWGLRLFLNNRVPMQTEYANNGVKKQLELPDGTRVWLREDASIEFPTQFDVNERRVQLIGEAFFEVTHNPAQPFRVQLPDGGCVEVLGTQFNVKALPGADQTSVLVRSGKVRFSPDGKQQGTILVAGQKAVFERKTNRIQVKETPSYNELAWQTGGLEFVHAPLRTVISDLEQHYLVKITLTNTDLNACTYTAPLTNQPIEKVLNTLALTYQMQLKKNSSGAFELVGGKCK